MSIIFGFSVKNCLKISYYIYDLENIAGQCNKSNIADKINQEVTKLIKYKHRNNYDGKTRPPFPECTIY